MQIWVNLQLRPVLQQMTPTPQVSPRGSFTLFTSVEVFNNQHQIELLMDIAARDCDMILGIGWRNHQVGSISWIFCSLICCRSSSRQRFGSTSYGESSLKAKIKEQNSASLASSGLYTGPQKRYNNRYGHISGLETMQELCEDLETSQAHTVTTEASTVTVRRSRRRSSIEPFANELTDQSNQSSCSGRPTSDVASTSESCSRSAEHTRYCEKSPGPRSCTPQRPSTPQRPGTPQKRSISQPATSPRKKAEPQTKSPARTKATTSSSQASTPRSSSPVVLSSSLKRPPRAASPSLQQQQQQHDGMDQSRKSLAGSRPIRRAAEVVVSYKEPSLITKMRRPAWRKTMGSFLRWYHLETTKRKRIQCQGYFRVPSSSTLF